MAYSLIVLFIPGLWEDGMGHAQITVINAGPLTNDMEENDPRCDGLISGSSHTSWLAFCVAKEGNV